MWFISLLLLLLLSYPLIYTFPLLELLWKQLTPPTEFLVSQRKTKGVLLSSMCPIAPGAQRQRAMMLTMRPYKMDIMHTMRQQQMRHP